MLDDEDSIYAASEAPDVSAEVIVSLLSLEISALSPRARLAALRLSERASSVISAQQVRLLAAIATPVVESANDPDVVEPEREDVAVALRLAPLTAARRLTTARDLASRHPQLLLEMSSGRVGLLHATAISEESAHLSRSDAQQVTQRLLPLARHGSVGRLRRSAASLAAHLNPASTELRHARARSSRSLSLKTEFDGMARLELLTDRAQARRVYDAADAHARMLVEQAAPGTLELGAARADALVELVLGGTGTADRGVSRPAPARIAVVAELATVLGLSNQPGDVPGLGPIPASIVRALATDADWVRWITDPTGKLIDADRATYRPSAALIALIKARDGHCQFPNCSQPAHVCDVDHIVPFDHADPARGGPTAPDNLQLLCRRHHRMKSEGQWRVTVPPSGPPVWTNPRGQVAPGLPESRAG